MLAFEVAGKEAERLPERIAEALRSEKVQKAIKDALDQEARKLMEGGQPGQPPDPKRGETVAKELVEVSLNAVSASVRKQIEHSPQVRKLEAESKQLLEDFKASRVGVWVNENRTLVYVVGAVLALGGGAALYFTRSGNSIAKFAEGKGKTIKLGTIEISGKITKFQPSTQALGASVGVTGNLKNLKADFKLSGTAVGRQGTVSAKGKILVPLTGSLTAMTSARFDLGALPGSNDPRMRLLPSEPLTGWNQFRYQVVAGLSFKNSTLTWDLLGLVDNTRPSGTLKATYRTNLGDWRLQASGGINAAFGKVSTQGTLGLTSRRPGLPLEINAQGDLDSHGMYKVQTNLVFRFD